VSWWRPPFLVGLFRSFVGQHTSPPRHQHHERTMRAALVVPVVLVMAGLATAGVANAQGSPPDQDEGWPPVPPIKEQSIESYCIHRNLLYSMGAILCAGGQGLVCTPSPGSGTGGRAYWSSVPVSRGDINWTPPAHCGR
jgi:hypothetical protein